MTTTFPGALSGAGAAGLPLAVWAGLLTALPVLAASAVAAGLLAGGAGNALAVASGAVVGLALSVLAVLGAARLAAALRGLRDDAVRRLQSPTEPVGRPSERPLVARVSTELDELACMLEALHLRVRLGDQVGERHRREAATAGAGVLELLSGLVAAEEGARGQLAAELHDTVAQSLMTARGLLAGGASTPAQLATLGDYVEDAEEQLRAVMARTRPPALRDGDLAGAVSGLRSDMRMRYALEVHLDWPDTACPLPLVSAVTLYRFFQEALLNVVKHANVDDARLQLTLEPDAVVARVTDEGPGFDPAAVKPVGGRHVGLGLLKERARLAGGSLEVDSPDEGGTTLTLRLPRPTAAEQELSVEVPAPRRAPSLTAA